MRDKRDDLEKFVDKHKDDFNQKKPSDAVWSNIKGTLPIKEKEKEKVIKMIPLRLVLKIAAAFLILLGVGALLIFSNQTEQTMQIAEVEEVAPPIDFTLGSLSPELAEIEEYYGTQVANKLSELSELNIEPEVMEEVNLLNNEFNQLQEEFPSSVNDEIVIEAMIENYRIRLDLLEDILTTLNQTEKEIKDENDTEDIVIFV